MKIPKSAIWLIISALIMSIVFIYISTVRSLTSLETVLFQVIIMGLGLTGSYIFGKYSSEQAAKDLIKPHARSAFRRLISLYNSLSRLGAAIDEAIENEDSYSNRHNILILEKLESIVIEQLATADDAMEDWHDLVPEEVDELKKRLKGNNNE